MAATPTLLCIHRDPARLRVLQENGYKLLTAANGHEGLQLFGSRPVDAIVLEYNLGLLDGAVIASEIKQVKPNIPIVMVAEHEELPAGALQSVDVLVSTSDPPHFLWAAVHVLLTVKPARHGEGRTKVAASRRLRHPGRTREGLDRTQGVTLQSVTEERDAPFSASAWKSILNGTVQF